MVPDSAEGHPLPDLQPLQVANNQDRAGPAAAHHAGPLPLQHARLPGQETAGGLRDSCWEDRGGQRRVVAGRTDTLKSGRMDGVMDGWMFEGEFTKGTWCLLWSPQRGTTSLNALPAELTSNTNKLSPFHICTVIEGVS